MADPANPSATAPSSTPARKPGRLALKIVGGLLAILLVLILLAPTIAGSIAPGIIESRAGGLIAGTVKVDNVSLSWGGPQVIGPLTLAEKGGASIAQITVKASKGLLGLATGGLDLGTVELSGQADIVRDKSGVLNVQQATAPSAPAAPAPQPSSAPPSVPAGLKVELVAKALRITYTDKAASPEAKVALSDIDIRAAVAANAPIDVSMSAKASKGNAGAATGTIAVTAKIDNWSDSKGLITTDAAQIDARISAKSLPSELIDALAGASGGAIPAGALQRGLGDTTDLEVVAKGGLKDATAQLTFTAPNANASASIRLTNSVVTTESPIVIRARGLTLSELAPQIQKALAAQDALKLDALPDLSVSIDKVRAALPTAGKALDLRGTSADVLITLSQARGTLKLDQSSTPEAFSLSGLEARLSTADLSTLRLTSKSSATVGGRSAGEIDVDMTVGGVLDAAGAPVKGLPASIKGRAAIKGIATAIAQPFVKQLELDLPSDVGPTIDLDLTAATIDNAPASGSIPPTNIDFALRSAGVRASGGVRLDAGGITTRDSNGITAELPRAGAIARRFVKPETGWELSRTGGDATGALTASIRDLRLPFKSGTTEPQIDKLEATVVATLSDWAARPLKSSVSEPVSLSSVRVNFDRRAGASPKLELAASGSYASQPFTAAGALNLPGLLAVKPAGSGASNPLLDIKPDGKLEFKSIPTALVRALSPAPAPGQREPDLGAVLRDVVGGTVNATVTFAAGPQDSREIVINTLADHLASDIKLQLHATRLDVPVVVFRNEITPRAAATVIQQFAPDLASTGMRVTSSPVLSVTPEPFSIPLEGLAPKLDRAGDLKVKVTLGPKLLVEGLTMKNDDGSTRPLGTVGIDGLEINAAAPIRALASENAGAVAATLAGTIIGEAQRSIAALTGDIRADVFGGKPAGPVVAKLGLRQIDTRAIESIIGKPGLISGAIGETLAIETTANLTPPPTPQGSPAGKPFDPSRADIAIAAALSAPRLRTSGPINAAIKPDRIALQSPATLEFDADPTWVNAFLEAKPVVDAAAKPGAKPAAKPQPAPLRLAGVMPVKITLASAAISRSIDPQAVVGPFKPGIFDLNARIAIDQADFTLADGSAARFSRVSVAAASDPKTASAPAPQSAVTFNLAVGEAAVAGKPAAKDLKLDGRVDRLAGVDGVLDIKKALLTANGDLPAVPTALVDALAAQDGLLVDALGPMTGVKLRADRLSLSGENAEAALDFALTSERATAQLRGHTGGGVFISDTPVEISVVEVTEALAARFVKGLPAIGSFQKTRGDTPATIVGTNLKIPLSSDFSKLNGQLQINPGVARFGTSSAFGEVLKLVKVRDAGLVGRRLEPLTVTIENGLMSYPRYKLPLGEFTVESEGRVDMVARQVDVVTWVPFGALTDEVAGLFRANAGLGAALGKIPGLNDATMMPIRTSGSLDDPRTKPDFELFVKQVIGNITQPEKAIEEVGNLLGDLLKKKK